MEFNQEAGKNRVLRFGMYEAPFATFQTDVSSRIRNMQQQAGFDWDKFNTAVQEKRKERTFHRPVSG